MSVVERVRREIERNTLRVRNGVRLAAGVSPPGVGQTPKEVVWRSGRTELRRYRSDRVSVSPPLLIVYSLFNRSYILDLLPGNSFVEHLLKQALTYTCWTGASPTSAMPATHSMTTLTTTCRPQSNASVRSLTTTR